MTFDHDTSLGCVPSGVFAFGLRLSMGRDSREPTFTGPLQTGAVDPEPPFVAGDDIRRPRSTGRPALRLGQGRGRGVRSGRSDSR
jgi:hypothetical protein